LGIAVDDAGSAYVSGGTASPDFPVTGGAIDTSHNGFEDAFVAKLNPDGSAVVWATFLGGDQVAGDFAPGVAVDGDGNVYVSGGTGSPEFPTTSDAHDPSHNGAPGELDAFVAKLDPSGSKLLYSTFLGGKCKDAVTGIAIDEAGDAYVAGSTVSPDFPATEDALRKRGGGGEDAFVAKLDADGSRVSYATYVGGNAFDKAQDLAIDKRGRVFLTGWTGSSNFPTTSEAFDERHNGGEDAFVAKLNTEGSDLVYASYLGGPAKDRGSGVTVDDAGSAYITGWTASPELPTTSGAFAEQYNGGEDAFVAKLNANGSKLTYATYLGGTALDFGRGIAMDASENVYVTGRTESPDYPTVGASAAPPSGGRDALVTKLIRRGS
jgi:hypothetical protein